MNNQPLVSIIIPTYNRAHLIGETLDSVLAQTYPNWECIIVDDGSNDNTDEVVGAYVEKDPRFKYYHRPDEHLHGGNGARNYGFKMSKGDYIQWFDSDDLMLPKKLELQVNAMLENNVEIVISNFKKSTGQINSININYLNNLLSYHIAYGALNTVMLFFNKEFIGSFKFNENLFRAQEYEFYLRVLGAVKSFNVIDEVTVIVRMHKDSISANYNIGANTKHQESMLYAKLKAYTYSIKFDRECSELAKKRYLKVLWSSAKQKETFLFFKYYFKFSRINKKAFFSLPSISLTYLSFFIFSKHYYFLKNKIIEI